MSARRRLELNLKSRAPRTDSAPMFIVPLALAALFAWLGYREASRHQAEYGRSPWGISPELWGVIVFASGLVIGGVLLFIARRSDRKKGAAPAPAFAAPEPAPTAPKAGKAPKAEKVVVAAGRGRPGSVL
jgi:hypothetical protein